jgi:hypothetical protein
MYRKNFREKDRRILQAICDEEKGVLWRSPLIEAMKRAGARIYVDSARRLHAQFGVCVLHISHANLSLAEGHPALGRMAKELLDRQAPPAP